MVFTPCAGVNVERHDTKQQGNRRLKKIEEKGAGSKRLSIEGSWW